MKRIIAAVVMFLMGIGAAPAAEIESTYLRESNSTLIALVGKIDAQDYQKFKRVAEKAVGKTMVLLASPGGLVFEAIDIGEYVHTHHFVTFVPDATECASACGYIWIAGHRRMVQGTAKVGFHAVLNTESQQIASNGNAVVGAYLSRLGLSYGTIFLLTSAPPKSMFYLTPEIARAQGIAMDVLPSTQAGRSVPDDAPVEPERHIEANRSGTPMPGVQYARPSRALPDRQSPDRRRYAALPVRPRLAPPEAPQVAPQAPLTEDEVELRDRLSIRFSERNDAVGIAGLNQSVEACYNATLLSLRRSSAVYCASLDILTFMEAASIEKRTGVPVPDYDKVDAMKERIHNISMILGEDPGALSDRAALVAVSARSRIAEQAANQDVVAYDRLAYCRDVARGFAFLGGIAGDACRTLTP